MKSHALSKGEIIWKQWEKKWQILKIFFRATGAISNKLGTNHPWVKGIQISSIKEPRLYQRGDNWETVKMNWQLFKNLLLQNHRGNFNQTWHKASFGNWNLSLLQWRAMPFPKEILSGNKKIKNRQLLKIFFSRTSGRILSKLDTKHSWLKGIQVCSN